MTPTLGEAFSSARHGSGISSNEDVIHRGSGVLSQSGPHFHNWLVANSVGVSPLDRRSAGFSLPGQ